MSTLIRRAPADLLAQREQLLAEVHMDYKELRERAETYTLSARELAIWHTIEGIDYLLDG
ncbi:MULTISPECIES: hypothetical protein [Streptomyces]|uniref:hypothetical protein n=1 Tax=Streptomyces TaxID=1883 RepID=UPI0033CEE9E2